MSEYEDIIEESAGKQTGGNTPVEEGFQEILLKELQKTDSEYNKFHDISIDIAVAPIDYPDWNINESIAGDWNLKTDRSATIWKTTRVIDIIMDNLYNGNDDVNSKALFNTKVEPPQLIEEDINAINDNLQENPIEIYGYLFEAQRKNSDNDNFFWRCHYLLTDTEKDKEKIIDSFNNWKTNKMVQQNYLFKDDVEDEEVKFEPPEDEKEDKSDFLNGL